MARRSRTKMRREQFERLVEDTLDALPVEFRGRMQNLTILVREKPPRQADPDRLLKRDPGKTLLMGEFIGVPDTDKSQWDLSPGPDHIVLYQMNIEAVCESEEEIREEIRLTLWHELGHYFGMTEEQLRDI